MLRWTARYAVGLVELQIPATVTKAFDAGRSRFPTGCALLARSTFLLVIFRTSPTDNNFGFSCWYNSALP
jgi:hypothetical protein